MRSWAEVVKANAHIPIPPPAVSLPTLKREVLRLGGDAYAVFKAKKQKEKTKKEEEQRKKFWAEEKASEEFWYKQLLQELDREYQDKLEESFPKEFEDYINRKKCSPETTESAKELYEKLMAEEDYKDDEILLEEPYEKEEWDDPYEKLEKEARRRAMFLHSMGDYEGVYKIATRYYFI